MRVIFISFTIVKHFMQETLDPEMLKILSCVNIDSSLLVIEILAPLSSAILRIVAPPRPDNKSVCYRGKERELKIERDRERQRERERDR